MSDETSAEVKETEDDVTEEEPNEEKPPEVDEEMPSTVKEAEEPVTEMEQKEDEQPEEDKKEPSKVKEAEEDVTKKEPKEDKQPAEDKDESLKVKESEDVTEKEPKGDKPAEVEEESPKVKEAEDVTRKEPEEDKQPAEDKKEPPRVKEAEEDVTEKEPKEDKQPAEDEEASPKVKEAEEPVTEMEQKEDKQPEEDKKEPPKVKEAEEDITEKEPKEDKPAEVEEESPKVKEAEEDVTEKEPKEDEKPTEVEEEPPKVKEAEEDVTEKEPKEDKKPTEVEEELPKVKESEDDVTKKKPKEDKQPTEDKKETPKVKEAEEDVTEKEPKGDKKPAEVEEVPPKVKEAEEHVTKKEPKKDKKPAEDKKEPPKVEETEEDVIKKEPKEDKPPPEDKKEPSKKYGRAKSEEEYRLRNIFIRPRYAEPKHPILSSPFSRHISAKAFGPKKPKWYTPLTSAQLYLFKDIMNYVEIGRQGLFHFDDFMEALTDFEPSVTRGEVLEILDSMEKDEFEELDFGKFLFLLSYREHPPDSSDQGEIDKKLSSPTVTPRQCLILSAIAYYVLIVSPEEIERYYIGNTRRKATVLHFHMESGRLVGLTEKQMEDKQKKAMKHLGPLFAITGSPYAYPVPFVPRFKKTKVFREWTAQKLSAPKSAVPMKKKPISRPIKPIKQSRNLGDPVKFKSEDDRTYYNMHYGRIPMPIMNIPEKKMKKMRKECTVELKDYITRKAYEALGDYKHRLKKATVLYNQRSLDTILRKGFPTQSEEETFIELYKRYMPLELSDVQNFSLWVRPAGYELKHDGKPLNPEKYAFGSKIT